MSGGTLNQQLTSCGGRLLETTHTSTSYRMHAIHSSEGVSKPGLTYHPGGGNDSETQAQEVEIWEIPEGSIGAILVTVPRPLGLGTVVLQDGRTEKVLII